MESNQCRLPPRCPDDLPGPKALAGTDSACGGRSARSGNRMGSVSRWGLTIAPGRPAPKAKAVGRRAASCGRWRRIGSLRPQSGRGRSRACRRAVPAGRSRGSVHERAAADRHGVEKKHGNLAAAGERHDLGGDLPGNAILRAIPSERIQVGDWVERRPPGSETQPIHRRLIQRFSAPTPRYLAITSELCRNVSGGDSWTTAPRWITYV